MRGDTALAHPPRDRMRRKAVWALVTALLALGLLVGAAAAAKLTSRVGLAEGAPAVPAALVLSLVSLWLARRSRAERRRTLVPSRGGAVAVTARGVAVVALIVAVTAALALAVFAVLSLALD
jgi:hypothetical protein